MRCGRAFVLFIIFIIGLLWGCGSVQTISVQELEASPAGRAVQFFYESQGGSVEGYLVRPEGPGPFPLIVLLHGHSFSRKGANRIVPAAVQISKDLCYVSLAISLPGYGSTRLAGENDKEVIDRVVLDGIAQTRRLSWVNGEVVLYGFSRGAFFVATLASKVPGLRSIILHSGAYDIARLYQDTPTQWVRQSINPNGEGHPHLLSVLPEVPGWSAPALILHGARDQVVPSNQAFLLRERLEALSKPYRFVIFPDAGHFLPLEGVKEEVYSFLDRNVGRACRVSAP